MNRLIALKHKADESLVSNASANDGYETANDETMGNASVSMYFSMNESDMSLDKTIEAQPHQQIANDPSSSPSFSNKKLRIVLTPIADSANYMSPKKNLINGKRNQTTSTPLKGATAVIVKAAAAPDDDDEEENEENSPNSSVATARKVIIIKADVVNSATKKSPSKTPAKELSGIEMMDTSQTIEEAKYASDIIDSIEITEFKASDAAVVATVDVPAPADTNTKSTQADAVVAEKPATAQRSSLSAAFRRNAWAGAALSTIVEKSSGNSYPHMENVFYLLTVQFTFRSLCIIAGLYINGRRSIASPVRSPSIRRRCTASFVAASTIPQNHHASSSVQSTQIHRASVGPFRARCGKPRRCCCCRVRSGNTTPINGRRRCGCRCGFQRKQERR